MERKTKGNIMMLVLRLIDNIFGIVDIIVTIIDIQQSIKKNGHQKSDHTLL